MKMVNVWIFEKGTEETVISPLKTAVRCGKKSSVTPSSIYRNLPEVIVGYLRHTVRSKIFQ